MRSTPVSLLLVLCTACPPEKTTEESPEIPDSGGDSGTDSGGVPGPGWTWGSTLTMDDADASLLGEEDDDGAGVSVLIPGDVDGDGLDDLFVGASASSELVTRGGKVYEVPGQSGGWTLNMPLGSYGAVAGNIEGSRAYEAAVAGDLDADGLPEIAINLDYQGAAVSSQFIMFSGSTWAGVTPLDEADLVVSASYSDGSTPDGVGFAMGDVDADGIDDLAISGVAYNSGELHVVAGVTGPGEHSVPEASALWIHGDDNHLTYFIGAGDLNGDGLGDALARHQDWTTFYVLLTPSEDRPVDRLAADVATATLSHADDWCTGSVIGDVNADGLDDIALALCSSEGAAEQGTYLFFGREDWTGDLGYEDADASLGMGSRLFSAARLGDLDGDGFDDVGTTESTADRDALAYHYFFRGGPSLAGAVPTTDALTHISPGAGLDSRTSLPNERALGDFTGDGRGDVLLAAPSNTEGDVINAGRAFLFAGREDWEAELSTDDADLQLVGSAKGQELGSSGWVGAGDLNGDGIDDLAFGSYLYPLDPSEGSSEAHAGQVFLFFGQPLP